MKSFWSRVLCVACAIAMVLVFHSCKKETKAAPSVVQTVQVAMGKDYGNQFFYQLSSNTIVSNNPRDNWDLALESGATGYHVYLNSAKFMFAYSSGKTTFDSTYTFSNLQKYTWVDQPSGNPDSTAIGDWTSGHLATGSNSKGEVYLIDRGKTAANVTLEKRKLKIVSNDNGTYTIKYANLDGTDEHTVQVPTDADHSFSYLSLDNGGQQITVAPPKSGWDLEFTMYTHVFDTTPPGIPIPVTNFPYLLNGVLLNPNTVSVSKDTFNDVPFDSVTLAFAQTRDYSKAWNTIGYDWKTFDFADENYTIAAHNKYLIKTSDGKYYKLRFTDFYNTSGVKGYPTFQVQLLQ